MTHYILTMRDDHYWLTGPFASGAEAGAYGSDPRNNSEDDPRWQVLTLADPAAAPEVRAP